MGFTFLERCGEEREGPQTGEKIIHLTQREIEGSRHGQLVEKELEEM